MILAFAYETKTGGKVPSDEVEERDNKYFHKTTGEELRQIVAKMSKSLKNVVNPDDVTSVYGADSLRLYEMFMGPLDAVKPWADTQVKGVFNFLTKACRFFGNPESYFEGPEDAEVLKLLHQTIQKVAGDIESLHFNTGISQLMILTNLCIKKQKVTRTTGEIFAKILSPFAPHLGEELWETLGHKLTLAYEKYPEVETKYLVEETFNYPVSFNGKKRFEMELPKDMPAGEIEKAALTNPASEKWLEGKTPKKVIIIPNRIINIVV
jgi:leucyl-tRNA synthetase